MALVEEIVKLSETPFNNNVSLMSKPDQLTEKMSHYSIGTHSINIVQVV